MSRSLSRRKHARRRAGVVNLYGQKTSCGWPIIGQTSVDVALSRVREGWWKPLYYESGELAGYVVLKAHVKDEELPARDFSVTTIVAAEIERNAFSYIFRDGKSQTERMNEFERQTRKAFNSSRLEPEDDIERLHVKIAQYTSPASRINRKGSPIFGDRAVRVYPREATF